MHRWLAVIVLMGALVSSNAARAQTPISLGSLQVQLWPEYDQPSMLVISDFKLPDDTKLPVGVSLRFPKEANLVAVASQTADGTLLNTDYQGPTTTDAWQSISIQIQSPAVYHVEYYQPLSKSGTVRSFAYLWPGDYGVSDLTVSIRLPLDATDVSADPAMQSSKSPDGTPYLRKDFGALSAGQQLSLQLTYSKASDSLTASQQDLRPSEPLGAATEGRVMLSNYLPYVIGVLGLALVAGGIVYFWQSSRGRAFVRERRHRRALGREERPGSEVYCHQCGTRAYTGDRFCRVCGTQLRQSE
jgi:hypothetical protein